MKKRLDKLGYMVYLVINVKHKPFKRGDDMDWKTYVKEEAANRGIPFRDAWMLFEVLGPSEAYDGFITMLEDMAEEYA